MSARIQTACFPLDGPAGPSRGLKAWLGLALGLAVLAGLMFLAGPLGLSLPGYKPMAALIDERGLRSNAIYYTDIEEFAEAEAALRSRLEWSREAGRRTGAP